MKYATICLLLVSGGAVASPIHLSCRTTYTPYLSTTEYYNTAPLLNKVGTKFKWLKDIAALDGGYVYISDDKILHLSIDAEQSIGWWSAQDVSTVGTFPIKANHHRNSYEWRGPDAGERSIYYQIDRSSLLLKSDHLFTKKFQQQWLETHGKPFYEVQFYEFQCKIDDQKI